MAAVVAANPFPEAKPNRTVAIFLDKAGARYVDAKDAGGTTALINASFRGRREVVDLLLNSGADINAKNDDGNTPLMAAAWHNRLDVIQMLLDCGASCNQVNNGGFEQSSLTRRTNLCPKSWRA